MEEIPWTLQFVLGIGDVIADAQSLLKVLTHFGQLSLEISARASYQSVRGTSSHLLFVPTKIKIRRYSCNPPLLPTIHSIFTPEGHE